jgi:ArsR family transcriptional regulator
MHTTQPSRSLPVAGLAPPVACCAPLAAQAMSDEEAGATAAMFKALGDPTRVRIVNLLATSKAPVCVCELLPHVRLSQPTVSHHLKKLADVGLLQRAQRGTWAFYSLDPAAMARLASLTALTEG